MNNKVVFGSYYHADSWIHKLDPRCKIITVFAIMILLAFTNNVLFLVLMFVSTIILMISSKVPIKKFLRSIKALAFLLCLTFIFQLVLNKNGDLLHTFSFNVTLISLIVLIVLISLFMLSFKYRRIRKGMFFIFIVLVTFVMFLLLNDILLFSFKLEVYSKSIETALIVLLRILTIIFLSSILTLTTTTTSINNGLDRLLSPLKLLKINTSIFTMMLSIALRFIPTLFDEAIKILKAQASRGVDINEGSVKNRIKQIIALLIPMFVISYNRAQDLTDAMEARGYDPSAKRTSIIKLKYSYVDYKVLFICLFLITSIIVFSIIGLNLVILGILLSLILISIWV